MPYQKERGPFTMCNGYFDSSTNKFIKYGATNRIKCCLRTCLPFVNECRGRCTLQNKEKCNQTCDQISTVCEDTCQLESDLRGEDNPLFTAAKNKGCGTVYYDDWDMDCLFKNKEEIITECQDNCLPTFDTGCQKHCQYSFDEITDAKNLILRQPVKPVPVKIKSLSSQVKSDTNSPLVKSSELPHFNMKYVYYPILIVVFFFFCYKLYERKFKNESN